MASVDGPDGDRSERRAGPTAAIGAELDRLDEQPVVEHVAVLERVNAAIAAELAALDEV